MPPPRLLAALLAAFSALPAATALAASIGTLLHYDFESDPSWPENLAKPTTPAMRQGPQSSWLTFGETRYGAFGTIDLADTSAPSRGLLLTAQSPDTATWSEALRSGPLALKNSETRLAHLTLAFSLSATRALPIKVVIESFDADQRRTGGIARLIHPAAAHFYQRFALDLSTFQPSGDGAFDPAAPHIGFTYEIGSATGWPSASRQELKIDNVHLARAAYYVSPKGDDTADGRTEATAFATPQRALDAAHSGDIILVMDGHYTRRPGTPELTPVAQFVRPGGPSGWITLKNHPGHRPTFSSHGQPAVNIDYARKTHPGTSAVLAYLEVRGLHVRGNGDTAHAEFPAEIGTRTPNTDIRGIVVNGRRFGDVSKRVPDEIAHHIRVADNVIEFCTSDGLFVQYGDWIQLENNTLRDNCWATPGFSPSGLAVMNFANFDAAQNITKFLIAGNRVSGTRVKVKNFPARPGVPNTSYFNGNGFLLDANAELPPFYNGRTLVQNNLAFDNGGAGIQMWSNHRMDVVNNTLHLNGAQLAWGQVGFDRCTDVRFLNNILVAPPGHPLDRWIKDRLDVFTLDIVRANNLYWGGDSEPVAGINDLVADPLFVNPSADPAVADFRLRPDSPARAAARWESFAPITDLDGNPRPTHTPASLGAYQIP